MTTRLRLYDYAVAGFFALTVSTQFYESSAASYSTNVKQASLSDVDARVPLCEEMYPESAGAGDICWSSCLAMSAEPPRLDPAALCDQASLAWSSKFAVSLQTDLPPPARGCLGGQHRLLCVASEVPEPTLCAAIAAGAMGPGEICFSDCGAGGSYKCEMRKLNFELTTSYEQSVKMADCTDGARVMCRAVPTETAETVT